ncbi:hypothetical protein ACIQBJ_31865 [Kitasatospora sp. NPDC088391]|uniref:hypothetical protein n=1 Tax=Kitasatospora sp. NPDC088391 TaxID=3364074 RepID=UPI0038105FD9
MRPDGWRRGVPAVGTRIQEDGEAALYLAAAETGTDPAEIGAGHIRALYTEASRGPAFLDSRATRLTALGHDLDDAAFDPVTACWQVLRHDHTVPDTPGRSLDATEAVDTDLLMSRHGPGLLEGLGFVLSDHMRRVAARAADPATAAWWQS